MSVANKSILITIDVEDWFQVENFKPWIPFSSWDSYELRVEKNTHHLLDLFDSINLGGPQKVAATFFVLGWIAERLPHLVREIHDRGHEVASHGYNHNLCNLESKKDLKKDLIESKKLLEDIIGAPVFGYRAPSFSINNDTLRIIEESGYLYDSSYNSFEKHGRYGKILLNGYGKNGVALKISDNFVELPISNLKFKIQNSTLPWGGGGYFRLIPFPIFKKGVSTILEKQGGYAFYLHPWEIDPQQPKVDQANPFYKFRHYTNLSKTLFKLRKLIQEFSYCRFITCRQYLSLIPEN